MEEAPDLILGLEPGYRIGWQSTLGGMPPSSDHPEPGQLERRPLLDGRHRRSARSRTSPLREPASLQDIAPTVLDLLGVTPPEAMDGTSLLSR